MGTLITRRGGRGRHWSGGSLRVGGWEGGERVRMWGGMWVGVRVSAGQGAAQDVEWDAMVKHLAISS